MTSDTIDRTMYDCPDWCVAAHDPRDTDEPHSSNEVNGSFSFYLYEGELTAILALELDNNTDLTADRVRQLADDARAAADWMEAHAVVTAVSDAEAKALADHQAGTCSASEWSCSLCEAGA